MLSLVSSYFISNYIETKGSPSREAMVQAEKTIYELIGKMTPD